MASIVQVASAQAGTASNLSATFSSPTTAGNAIWCLGQCVIGPGLLETFTFTAPGCTFQIIDNQFNLDANPLSDSVAFNCPSVSTVNMALLYPNIGDNFASQMFIVEIEGVFALDPGLPLLPSHLISVNDFWPTPGMPLPLSPITVALNDPFIMVGVICTSNPVNVYTAGSGYTIPSDGQINQLWNGSQYSCLGIESGQFTATGPYTPTIIGSEQPTFVPFLGVNAVVAFATGEGPPPPPAGGSTFSPCGKMPTVELTRDLDADWGDESTFFITQDQPFPFTLRGLVMRMSYNQD